MRSVLLRIHRWLAILLAPLFLVVLLSGAVLALKPIVADLRPETPPVDPARIVSLLDRVDPAGKARFVTVSPDGRSIVVRPGPSGGPAAFAIESGEELPPPGFDFFAFAKELHEGLLVGARWAVIAAALAMLLVILLGPLLGWRRLDRTLLGWHAAGGWFLFPLLAMLPLTGVLFGLHLTGPAIPPMTPGDSLPIARGIERALADGLALEDLEVGRAFRAGSVMIVSRNREYWVVSAQEGTLPVPGGLGLARNLHEGTWGGAASGLLNLVTVLALTGLLGTGLLSWWRRRRSAAAGSSDEGADLLVAFATQTGTAARLAQATAEAMRAGGAKVAVLSLGALAPAGLQGYRRVHLIVSTTGQGEVPEQARSFLSRLEKGESGSLAGVSFSLLALGDRRYGGENFAAGGRIVREALLRAGAVEATPMVRADGDPGGAWKQWLEAAGISAAGVEVPQADRPVELRLVEKRQLNDPNDPRTREVWALTFESAAPLDFRPGDLLLVTPPGGGPERPYSIGSSPAEDPRRLLLTVALEKKRAPDGSETLGAASGLLCRGLAVGDTLRAALRSHPDFHPPRLDRPLILVSAGCGIGPFPGFVAEREAARARGERVGPIWFVFGNNCSAGDFLHRERIERWVREGLIDRLGTAFFLDEDDGSFAQHRLLEAGDELLDWMERRDAVLYVCGRGSTLGRGVDDALREILTRAHGADAARERLAAWEANGQIHRDLFG